MRFRHLPRATRSVVGIVTLIGTLCATVSAGYSETETPGEESPATGGPHLTVPLAAAPPIIDGKLDDPCWKQAIAVTKFWNDTTQTPPTQRTIAFICRDRRALYIAAHCFDTDPSAIRAFQIKRDGAMYRDDFFEVLLDSRNDHVKSGQGGTFYGFTVNPLGTQSTSIPGGSASKVEWEGDWYGAAQRVADGWTVEIAIPYAMLRYPRRQQNMGLMLRRSIERNEERVLWPPMKPRYDPFYAAELLNLDPPTPVQRPVVMPWSQIEMGSERNRTSTGVDAKYELENGLTLTGTAFPNYSDIEQDILGIDFSYAEKRQAEHRPFFLEGRGYFPSDWMFYSRRVENVDFGTKVFGETKNTRIGALYAMQMGADRHFVANVDQRLGTYTDASVGLASMDQDGIGNHTFRGSLNTGRPMGTGELRFASSYYVTHTDGKDDGDNDTALFTFSDSFGNDKPWFDVSYRDIGADYNPPDAYVPELDYKGFRYRAGIAGHSATRAVQDWSLSSYLYASDHHDGSLFTRQKGLSASIGTASGQSFYVGYGAEDRPPNCDHTLHLSTGWGANTLDQEGHVSLTFGHVGGARYLFCALAQGIKFNDHARIQLSTEYSRRNSFTVVQPAERLYQIILSGTYDITAEKSISTRTVLSDNGFNLYCAYRRAVRRGADLYVILGDPNAETIRARLVVKSVWTM